MEMAPFDRAHRVPISVPYDAILYRLRDIATYWSKISKFLYPIRFHRICLFVLQNSRDNQFEIRGYGKQFVTNTFCETKQRTVRHSVSEYCCCPRGPRVLLAFERYEAASITS